LKLIVDLTQLGVKVAVATNQQCVGKKLVNNRQLQKIHDHINNHIVKLGGFKINFYVCPHLKSANCDCRKPKPGLIFRIMNDLKISAWETVYIGDQLIDRAAANASNVNFLHYDLKMHRFSK